ncbi:MAG: hypothetical protein JNM14_00525 [Ferruginibacter sp.]|nr:hypothetical protein [Ferruginibacter sp.]
MKKISFALVCFFSSQYVNAQVSDSTVKILVKDICNCIDTVDINMPETELKKAIGLCKTISLTNLLNRQLITPELLTDEKKSAYLENRTFKQLAESCEAIKRIVASLNKVPSYREKNADNIFTPAVFFKTYGLKPGEVNNLLHVYNSENIGESKCQRLVDIRWTFESEADALEWHRKKIRENSESGNPVKERIEIEGAAALQVFREGSGAAKMLSDFGLKQRHHYFLFVYKNIACKVFVATDDKTDTRELVVFAEAAVKQLKAVIP